MNIVLLLIAWIKKKTVVNMMSENYTILWIHGNSPVRITIKKSWFVPSSKKKRLNITIFYDTYIYWVCKRDFILQYKF